MHDLGSSTTKIRPNLLRLMVENAVDAQYLVDLDRDEFLQCNQALCELLGRFEAELVDSGFKTLEIVHESDRAYIAKVRKEMKPADSRKIRFRCVRRDGELRWVEARTRMARYMGRNLAVGSARDVTEQVELEQRLRRRIDVEGDRLRVSEERAKEAIQSSHQSAQMLDTLSAIPELSKALSAKEKVPDLIKEACLFLTNHESGLKYGSCTIYVVSGKALEVGYANPFRLTTRIDSDSISEHQRELIEGKIDYLNTVDGKLLVPINTKEGVYGILEVGFGKTLEALMEANAELASAQEHVVSSSADFIGMLISNLILRESIHKQVVEDVLTGLFNRRFFHEKLETEFRRAVRYERDLSLLMLDLDHFKAINDNHGHAQGDVVLAELGAFLRQSFRDLDTIARIGGEEIAIIMPETSAENAHLKAERLRDGIEKLAFDLSASKLQSETNTRMHVTVSIGVAGISSGIDSPETFYQEADRALYISKNSGRNRVSIA